jgi:hypothetical protein
LSKVRRTSSNETSKGSVNAHFNLQENHRVFCSSRRDCFSRKFPRACEGWWGRRPFRWRRDVHRRRIWPGWFSCRRIWWGRFSPGRENVRRRIQPSPLLRRLQRVCAKSSQPAIFVALYVLKHGEASLDPCRPQRRVLGHRRSDGVGGGDGDAGRALTATFRYFVGFHSCAIRRASPPVRAWLSCGRAENCRVYNRGVDLCATLAGSASRRH